MKHYFLTAKHVGDLTAHPFAPVLGNGKAKPAPVLSRVIARLARRAAGGTLSETDDFSIDNNRINLARADVFERDPVNLIRLFYLAQKYNLAIQSEAMRAATRSLKLIDADVRGVKEANRLFLEILTSKNEAETVLRRMNEAGVLGEFVRAFGRIVAMISSTTCPPLYGAEQRVRCIGVLNEIEHGGNADIALASELVRTIQPEHRKLIYVALFSGSCRTARRRSACDAPAEWSARFAGERNSGVPPCSISLSTRRNDARPPYSGGTC